jgi:aminoglycoside phosphotransferase (APT) family kinase protein
MSEKGLSQAEKNAKAREIGEALSQIHGIKFRTFGEIVEEGLEEKYDSWQVFVEKLISLVREETEKEVVLEAVEILGQNIEMMDYGLDSVLLHGDFHDGNILDRQRLGILDCEAGSVGTREYEINRCISHWTEEWNCTEEFLEGYGRENLEEDWKRRRKFYNLLQAAMGIFDGVRLGSEHLVEINGKRLRKEMKKF